MSSLAFLTAEFPAQYKSVQVALSPEVLIGNRSK
jgi:hypothetical protein